MIFFLHRHTVISSATPLSMRDGLDNY